MELLLISVLLISIMMMVHGYILESHINDLHHELLEELEDLKKHLNARL